MVAHFRPGDHGDPGGDVLPHGRVLDHGGQLLNEVLSGQGGAGQSAKGMIRVYAGFAHLYIW